MKKILILLCVLLYGTLSMVRAQSPTAYFNVPDTVCMSTNNSTADQLKFTSINAQLNGATAIELPTWSIKRNGTGTTADYEILYSANTTTVKDDKLKRTKSLTLQFLTPGTYDVSFTVPYQRWNGTTATYTSVTKKLVVVDCTINTCSGGNASMPGFFENFGTMASGVNRRKYPVDGVVTYTYQSSGDLNDEYYVIGSNTQFRNEWVSVGDHTGGTRGAMLIANSAYQPNLFYQKTVTGLCKGSVYNFSAWFMNVNTQGVFESNCVSDYKYSGVTFRVVNAANVNQKLAEFKTYSVSMMLGSSGPTWQRYGGSFTVPSSIDSVKVYIINDKPGGCGNDIAVDDIEFQYCSPIITASIQGNSSSLKEVLCEGAPVTINSNYVPVTYFTNPAYQWEMSDDNGVTWTNVPFGTATSKDLVIPAGQLKGTRTVQADYLFRVRIYEVGSDATTCAAPSSPIKITILPMPTLYLTKSMVCVGADVQLVASGGFDYYTWKDLPGYTGDQRTIQVVTPDTTITVYGTIEYGSGGSMYTCVDSNYAYITSLDLPTVEVAASSTNVCAGTQVELRINSTLMGNTIRWEKGPDALGNKVPIPEGNDLTSIFVQTINPADSVYTVTVTDPTGTCTAASAPFKIRITPQPVVNPGTSQVLCASTNPSGDFKMNAVLAAGTTGSWSLQSVYGPGVDLSGGMTMEDYVTIANPNNPQTRVVINNPGVSAVFAWIVKSTANPNCTASGLDTLTLLYDPSYSDAGPDSTICGPGMVFTMHASQPNDTLTGPATETGTWRLISGNATIADIHDPNTTVTSLQMVGDIVLGWSITNTRGCTPNEDTVVLHKTARPTVTLAGPVISCNADGSFVIDTVATTGNPDTYSLTSVGANPLPGFTPIVEDTIIWPLTITYPAGTAPGIYNFRLSYRNKANAGCDSLTNFTVEVQTPPVAATGIAVGSPNICVTGSTTLTVVGGNLGQKANGTPNGQWVWYAGSCGGTPIGIGTTITVNLTATTTYYVRAEGLGACDTTVCVNTTVTVFDAPAAANAGPDQAQCMNPAFTVTGNAPTVGTGVWSLAPGFGSGTATIASPTTVTTGVTVPNGDSAKLYWTITNGVCSTVDSVILRNFQQPTTADAGPDQQHCMNPAFSVTGSTPSIGTGVWTLASGFGSGTATIATPNAATTNVTVPNGDSAKLYWTITNGVCSTVDSVILRNYLMPTTAAASADQDHCMNPAFTVTGNAASVGAGVWTVAPGFGSGTATIATPNATTTNVTVANGDSAKLYWTITNGTCITVDSVILRNFQQPTTADAGADQEHCMNPAFTVTGNAASVGTGVWTVAPGFGSGTATIATPNTATTNVTVPNGDSAKLYWTITNGTCSTVDSVILRNYLMPTTAAASADQDHCMNPTFTVTGNAASVGAGVWTVAPGFGSGTATIATPNATTTNVTVANGDSAKLYWTITNGVCVTRDSVILRNFQQPTTADAGLDQEHCMNPAFTVTGNAASVGTGVWTVAPGFGSGTATIATPNAATTNVTVANGDSAKLYWTITNGVCVTRDSVILRNYLMPTTAAASADQDHCMNPAFTVTGNAASVGAGVWTVAPGFGSGTATIATPNATTTNVTVPNGDSAKLYWTITNGTCSTVDSVILRNFQQPTTADAGLDQEHCMNPAFTVTGNAASAGTGVWTVAPGFGSGTATIATPNVATTNVTVANGDSAKLYWTITNGVCVTRDSVILRNYLMPTTAAAGADQDHCMNPAFTVTGNAASVGTGIWTVAPGFGSGTATIATPNATTTNVTVANGDSAKLYWTITNGSCSTVDSVILRNFQQPTTADAGPDQEHCMNPAFTVTGNAASVGAGVWTVASGFGSGAATIATPNVASTNVTVPNGDSAKLYWTITNGTCSTVDSVILRNYLMPTTAAASADQEHCMNPAFTVTGNAASVGAGVWTVAPGFGSGTATIATPNATTTNVTVANGDSAKLYWTITNGSCSTVDSVILRNFQQPTTADAGADQEHCMNPAFTVTGNAASVGTGVWTVAPGFGSGTATIATPNVATTNVTVPNGDSVKLYWTITNGTCSTVDSVILRNYLMPTTAAASADQDHCMNPTFTVTGNAASVGAGVWTVAPGFGSGTATIATPNATTTNVTVANGDSAKLYWTITNGTCSTVDSVILRNFQQPTTADAGLDQEHCMNPAFTVTGNAASVGAGIWTVAPGFGSGTATIATPNVATTNVTVANGDSAKLYWTITNGVCVTRDSVILRNYLMPTTAAAGADQDHCMNPAFTVTGNAASVGTGMWTVAPGFGSGTATIATPNTTTTNVTVANGDSAKLYWTITNGTCSTVDSVILRNFQQPTTADAGPDQEHCMNPAFTVTGNAASVGAGVWTVAPGFGSGTATIATPNATTTNVTVPNGDSAKLYWTITNGTCSTVDSVILRNFQQPTTADAGADQEHCMNPAFTVTGNAASVGAGVWTVASGFGSGAATIATPNVATTNVTVPNGDSVKLYWTITNGTCSTVDSVILRNYLMPTTAAAGADQDHCMNSAFTVTGNAPSVGIGVWTVASAFGSGTATIATPNATTTNVTVANGDSAKLYWTITNGTCSTVDSVILRNFQQPTTADAGPDQEHCMDPAFSVTGSTPSIGAGVWTLASGFGSGTAVIAAPTSLTTAVTVNNGDSAKLYWTITNGTCSTVDSVILRNYQQPAKPNAGPDEEHCNDANFTLAGSTPSIGTGNWSLWLGNATITDATLRNTTVTVAAGDSAYLIWTVTNGTCLDRDTVILRNYQQPLTANAGPDQEMCLNTAGFTMAAVAPTEVGAIGTWTVVSGPATIPAGQTHNPNVNIVLPNDATAVLRWTVTNGNCPPVSDDVQITNYLTPADANAGPDQDHCNDANFTMAGSTPDVTGAVGTWTVVLGNGTIAPSDINLPNAAVTVPQGDTAMLVWTIANPTCTSKPDTVILRNFQAPAPAAAGADQEHCDDANFTMAANVPSVGTGKWNVISGTVTIAPADVNNPTAVVVVPVGNTATLEWQITNGVCDTRDQVVLTNYQPPAKATAGPDQDHCDDANFTVAGNTPTVGTGTWSILNGTGTIDPTTINTPTALVGVNAGDTVSLVWTITNGVCVTMDTVILRNYIAPAASNAGADQEHCNDANFTMNGSTPSVGTGKWTLVSGKATIASTDSTLSNAPVIVAAGDTAILAWTITNGVCQTTDMVTLRNFMQPTQANAGVDVEHCNDANFTMNGSIPSVGAGLWTVHSGTATIAASTVTLPNATVTVAPGDTAVLYWTITNGLCTTVDSVILRNYMLPSAAAAGPDQDHCMDPNFTLAANTPAVGTGRWTVIQGAAVIANVASPTSTVTVPNGDSATLVWTISNGTCTATTDTVKLRNYLMPANANAGADQTNCDNVNFTMNATPVSPAYAIGTWTIVSGTPTITDIHNPSTTVQVPAGTSVTLQWTITNGTCTSVPDQVTLTNQPAILGNTITADQLLCANQTPAMLQGGTVSGGNGTFTYQWQVSTTSATTGFVNVATGGTNATYNPANITQNTWYRRVVMSGACTGNISNAIMLTLMNTPPVVISVPPAVTTDCVQGKDYTTLFGTPVFSHAPYTNEALTVTYNDVTTVVNACTTTIMRTWTATDRCGLATQAQQTITVVDRTAPVFSSAAPANVTVECNNVPAAVNLTAIDACNGTMTITPIEVRVDQPGACASNYQLIRKWVAVDACGNASDTLRQTITVRDMTAPVFDNPAPANITVDCDKVPAGAPLTATDNCTPGVITVNPVDTRKNISNSACADNYQIIRTWTATDLCGNRTVLTQTITVQDTIRPVFSMTVPSSLTVDCDKVPTVPAITATDNCTATIAVKVSEKKEFLSTTCLSSYRLTRTWTATDNCGNKNTMQQVILVQDTTRPTFTVVPPADTTVSCDAIPDAPANISATDNCGSVKISYTQSRESITGACAGNYRLIRTWTAKDNCSNTTVVRQVITVTDTTRPVIDPAPADVTLNCGDAIPVAATLYAKDNCDGTFPKKVTMTTDPYTVDVCAGYTIIRRWNISDACGNAAFERVQTITVNPCPKPQLDPNMAANCSNNTKFALMLLNKVSKPKFTLVGIVPAGTVSTPLTQTSNVFDLKGATQATFTVTDGVTGCVSDPVTYNLQYIPKPVVNLGNDTAICVGDNITLDAGAANAAYTIRWSTGATTQTITVNAAGTYYATVSNGICSTTDSIKVSVNNPPVVNLRDTAICEGQSVKLNAYVQGASYVWSTGETTASITVNMSGTYGVDVTLKGCTTHKDVTVTVNPAPQITLTDDITICPDATTMLTVDPDGGTVRWSTGETSNSIVVSKEGNYVVTVSRGGCVIKDSVEVSLRPDLTIDLGPDREFCTGGRVTVDATHPDAVSYMWNDGYTTPQREITLPGKYIVSVMDRFCSRITMDSINVTVAGIPATMLPNDTIICIGQTLTLKPNVGTANSIRWQDGSTNSTYVVSTAGTYTVTVSNECGTATDDITVGYKQCEAKPQFPNAFTPNNDGHNDNFKPIVDGPMYDYDLRIYNRWGELIFLSKDAQKGWDGKYKGKLVEVGTYVWMLTYKKMLGGAVNVVKGEVTAIR